MTLDLDELERLEKDAVPGHWACIADKLGVWVQCIGGEHVAEFQSRRDAALSVAARNALPELIARVRKAEARVAELEAVAACDGTHVAAHQAQARTEWLEARAAELEAACKKWREMGERADLKAAKLEAERKGKALVEVGRLREIEGAGMAAGTYREEDGCPVCGAYVPSEYDEDGNERGPQPIPHSESCWLAQAIKEASE